MTADEAITGTATGWRERARPAVARLAFPLVLGIALWTTYVAMQAGTAPEVAIGPATIGSFVVIFALERLFPYQREWLRSHGDIRVDATYALMLTGLIELIRPAVYTVALFGAGLITARWQGGVWPGDWPVVVQLAIALVVAELPKYWFHRLQHEHDWLWRIHAPHHSVPRLYWLNASRFHPIDITVDTLLGVGTLVALGCGEIVIALFLLTSSVHGAFQHANLELRCGSLNWIFSMAELHRWHHSRTVCGGQPQLRPEPDRVGRRIRYTLPAQRSRTAARRRARRSSELPDRLPRSDGRTLPLGRNSRRSGAPGRSRRGLTQRSSESCASSASSSAFAAPSPDAPPKTARSGRTSTASTPCAFIQAA